jgi:hypothetical protein
MQGKFGWEYKGKHKDLKAAYQQLLKYREALENPPLLVVCDLDRFEVHTNFTGTIKKVHAFDLDGLADPRNVLLLRHVFTEPETLKPGQTRHAVDALAFPRLAKSKRYIIPKFDGLEEGSEMNSSFCTRSFAASGSATPPSSPKNTTSVSAMRTTNGLEALQKRCSRCRSAAKNGAVRGGIEGTGNDTTP